jgi:hypothetical protein
VTPYLLAGLRGLSAADTQTNAPAGPLTLLDKITSPQFIAFVERKPQDNNIGR